MLKKLKHGFTLVELVIVIAVIAVLAAVLIPTFITVIDNANNSADLQLVANMNTVMSTNLDENVTATAENLRKYLSDNGLTDITTKKKDNVIVYNKAEKKFKRLNVKNTLSNSEIAYADGGTDFLEQYPYSVEEVFAGNMIVSTGGNALAEALHALHTVPAGLSPGYGNNSKNNYISNVINKLEKCVNYKVMEKFADVINSTAYVDADGNIVTFGNVRPASDDSRNDWLVSDDSTAAANPTRLVFNENITEFDLAKLKDYTEMMVVLPNTLTNLLCTEDIKADGKSFLFVGNTALITDKVEENTNLAALASDSIIEGTLENAKEGVATLGAQVTQKIFYVDSSVSEDGKDFHYKTVQKAMEEAQKSVNYSGKERTVLITDNEFIITGDVTIYDKITLEIPYYQLEDGTYLTGYGRGYSGTGAFAKTWTAEQKNDWNTKGYIVDGSTYLFPGETIVVDDEYNSANYKKGVAQYKKFNVQLNGNLTIEGTLSIGGVNTYDGQCYNGHVSGWYGQLNLGNNTITVEKGGVIDTYGYIKGGNIVAEKGADIREPFIVADFSGGSNSFKLYTSGQSPFLRYAMINIQSNLTVNYGAKLWAHCVLWASDMYNTTDQIVIGYDDGESGSETYGLITLESEDSNAVCSYDPKQILKVENSGQNNLAGDIGKTTVTIHGNARTESLSLLDMVSTSNVLFPVPFNFNFVIADGDFTVKNHYVILPGAQVTVNKNATLTVTQSSEFYVMDYLYQGAKMSGKTYPTDADLKSNGYEQSGIFTVNGTFIVENNAKVGGVVRAGAAEAVLDIKNADVSGKFDIGGVGAYRANTSSYEFPLRIYDGALTVKLSDYTLNKYKNADGGSGKQTYKLVPAACGTKYTSEIVKDNALPFKHSTTVRYLKETKDPTGISTSTDEDITYYMWEQVDLSIELSWESNDVFVFVQDSDSVQKQADAWKSAASAKTFSDLSECYADFYKLGLAVEANLAEYYTAQSSSLQKQLETIENNIVQYFTSEYVSPIAAQSDNIQKTLKANIAQKEYEAVAPVVQGLLKKESDSYAMQDVETFLNGSDSIWFTVAKGTLSDSGYGWEEAQAYTNSSTFVDVWQTETGSSYTKPVKFTLYRDLKLSEKLTLSGTRDVVIDVNGFTVLCVMGRSGNKGPMFDLTAADVNTKLTIESSIEEKGNINVQSDNWCTIFESKATLTIKNMNVNAGFNVSTYYAGSDFAQISGGKIRLENCNVTDFGKGLIISDIDDDEYAIVIDNCTFTRSATVYGVPNLDATKYSSYSAISFKVNPQRGQNNQMVNAKLTNVKIDVHDSCAILIDANSNANAKIYNIKIEQCEIRSNLIAINSYFNSKDGDSRESNGGRNSVNLTIINSTIISNAGGTEQDAVAIWMGGGSTHNVKVTNSTIIAKKDVDYADSKAAAFKFGKYGAHSVNFDTSNNKYSFLYASDDMLFVNSDSQPVNDSITVNDTLYNAETNLDNNGGDFTEKEGYMCYTLK